MMRQTKKKGITLLVLLLSTSLFAASFNNTAIKKMYDDKKPEEIINSYVTDFRNDARASNPIQFGIEIPDYGSWVVNVLGKKKKETWQVELRVGVPDIPTFIYRIEYGTLKAMEEGTLNAMTAQGKAFSGDYAPMEVLEMEDFNPTEEINGEINSFSFHFWTKGFPEVIPFGADLTRQAHGVNMVLFYYQKGFRSGWLSIPPKGKVRHDPREQAMPFPMLVVSIKGDTEGEMNGKRVSLSEGNALFIPPGTTHKWWNESEEEAVEAILIMFGKGA